MNELLKSVNEKAYRVLLVRDGKNDADWLRARQQNGVGASESPIICDLSPWGSIVKLYGQKIGLIEPDDENEAMRWGKLLEPVILEEYRRETGRSVVGSNALLQSIAHPYLLATPDGEQHAEDHDGPGIVQVKLTSLASAWKDGVPRYVWAQMQQEMFVTGYSWGTAVALLNGTKLVWADVEAEAQWEETLIHKCGDFWNRVVNREPIPQHWIDGSDDTSDAIKRMFPERLIGETAELSGEFFDIHGRLRDAEGLKEQAEDIVKTLRNQIKLAIGEKSFGRLPDGTTYSYKTQHRDGYAVQPTDFRVLRLMKGSVN